MYDLNVHCLARTEATTTNKAKFCIAITWMKHLKMKYFWTKSICSSSFLSSSTSFSACFLNLPIPALTARQGHITKSKNRQTPAWPYRFRHMINTHFPFPSKHIYKWSTHTYDQSWLINWLKQFFTTQRLQGRYLGPYVVCINHKSDQSDDWSSDSFCFCTASARPNVISLPRNA